MGLSYVLERLQDALVELTTGVLTALEPPVCRVNLALGPDPTWDSCAQTCSNDADGHLWATIVGTTVGDTEQCLNHKATVRIGILRCAAVISDSGEPPSAAAVSADAAQQAFDADAIYTVMSSDAFKHGFDLVGWSPLGPNGACVGGYWEYTYTIGTCI